MYKLVSKNLSTQFDKQLASLLENDVDGVLVPAHAREMVDRRLNPGLGVFLFQESCHFFLSGFVKLLGHGYM